MQPSFTAKKSAHVIDQNRLRDFNIYVDTVTTVN